VAEHVRVDLHIEACSPTSALDHRLKATRTAWCVIAMPRSCRF
jgi:hypothetical protein